MEKLESALCEKCDVDHSDCIGENECFCTLDMARSYQQGRADAIDEILKTIPVATMEIGDYGDGFDDACRDIRERIEQLKENKNEINNSVRRQYIRKDIIEH